MPLETRFSFPGEQDLCDTFQSRGYVIRPVENRDGLDAIRALIASVMLKTLDLSISMEPGALLDATHRYVPVDKLNALRLAVVGALQNSEWFRPTYFSLARSALAVLVGNELAMQRGIGLNVQLPEDDSSLLPIHADVWDGDSPFEVVVWLPLVDCFRTKSMYILPPDKDRPFQAALEAHKSRGPEEIYEAVSKDAEFLDIRYGSVLLFSQTLMHGNRVNREAETRWSLNCRFKSILSPYADKRLGEFFEPIVLRPATRVGLHYRLPGGVDE